jgi:hypothetical protein
MTLSFFTFLFIIWVVLFPLYLWAYFVSEYTEDTLSHRRFLIGLLIGGLWTTILFLSEKYGEILPLGRFFFLFLFISLLLLSVFLFSYFSSRIWGKFARTIVFAHTSIFLLLGWGIFFLERFILVPWVVSVFLLSFFSRAIVEEWAKHLSSIGLLFISLKKNRT